MSAPPAEADDAGGSGFYAQPHASLRARGLAGDRPEVFCVDGVLLLRDPGGWALDIPAAEVERLRLGMMSSKFAVYHIARLFLPGAAEPLLLMPREPGCLGYAGTMRRFAAAVAGARGLDRVERGLTGRAALVMFLAVLAVAIGASAMALLVWSREHGMVGAAAFTALMAGAVALFAWHAIAYEIPRKVTSLGEIDAYLPR